KDVNVGDVLEIETPRGSTSYRIERTWIVEPEDVSVLDPTPVRSVTLVTCYPFYFVGSAPQRFIVRAVRAASGRSDPEGATMRQTRGRLLWGAIFIGLAGLAVAASAQSRTTSTETRPFTVVSVDGNKLVAKTAQGAQEITVPEDFRFTVDGKEVSVHELKPGMKGTEKITTITTTTQIIVTEGRNGEVMQTSGNSAVVRGPNGIRMFSEGDVARRNVEIIR